MHLSPYIYIHVYNKLIVTHIYIHEIEIELGFVMHFTKMKLACFVAVVYAFGLVVEGASIDAAFDDIYEVVWGGDHVNFLNERRDAQLWMDPAYGSVQFVVYSISFYVIMLITSVRKTGAGFGSKLNYGSGFIHMRIKLPNKDSAGVVTAFYVCTL